ncbi:ammonium transmembrane transporter [Aureococcus anophagefferens]|nr:ammonium transmembrane transporter [Aureococcus anophagefferens]
MNFTNEELEFLDARYAPASVAFALDTHWVLYCGVLVLLMQAGFAMLCAGSIRAKNAQNILLKNLLDLCVGALSFWATGYAFAYGGPGDGSRGRAVRVAPLLPLRRLRESHGFKSWFFQFAFAATSATIVSGAVAERCALAAYAAVGSAAEDGVERGVDAALIATLRRNTPIRGHSMPLVVLGTFLLWIGWYGFNPGSTLALARDAEQPETAARVAVTTTLGAVAGGLASLLATYRLNGTYDVAEMCNGLLAGLASTTGSCAVVEPWAAVAVGAGGAWSYAWGAAFLERRKVDDAVNATAVHFFAGAWGMLAPALFAAPSRMRAVYGSDARGLLYGGDGSLLGAQAVAFGAIALWVGATMGPFFLLFRRAGALRVSMDEEIDGLDDAHHGGSAYEMDTFLDAELGKSDLDRISEVTDDANGSGSAASTRPTTPPRPPRPGRRGVRVVSIPQVRPRLLL